MSAPWDAVGIGVAVRDVAVRLDSYPAANEKVRAQDFAESGGGPVPTALVTLARLGARTALIGVVGDDRAGELIIDGLRNEGVDTSAIVVKPGFHSPTSVILVSGPQRTICEWRQYDLPLTLDEVRPFLPLLDRARALIVDARLAEIQIEAARRVRAAGGIVVLDCGHPRPGVEELLRWTDVAILADTYPRALGGDYFDPTEFLIELESRLAPEGRRISGLTRGENGCILRAAGSDLLVIPGIPVDAVDTTGAGDVFHGAFVYAFLKGAAPEDAARFANAAAALKCGGFTGRAPIPGEEEIWRWARRR
jgi:ribokinase